MNGPPIAPPGRWAPLTPQRWPQDENHVPTTAGLPMPPISAANAERARRESFTMSGSFAIPGASVTGQVFTLYLPTDQDGDFWCDQIAVTSWNSLFAFNTRAPPSTVFIGDARTGRALTYPREISINFLTTLQLYSEEAGFDPASSPFPDGFRSTTTLPQPFCFTRAGGIQLRLTLLAPPFNAGNATVDFAFGGWKEYEAASA
jgi:hypothetical protein